MKHPFARKTHGDQKTEAKIQRCEFEHSSKKNLLEIKNPDATLPSFQTKI